MYVITQGERDDFDAPQFTSQARCWKCGPLSRPGLYLAGEYGYHCRTCRNYELNYSMCQEYGGQWLPKDREHFKQMWEERASAVPFYTGPWPTGLAESPAETERQYVIRVLESVVTTIPSTSDCSKGNHKGRYEQADMPWHWKDPPSQRSVPTYEALVSALALVPAVYIRVRVDPGGLAFDKTAPNGSTGTLTTTDPRRLTYSVIEGSARLAMFTALKNAMTADRVKYKVSIAGALIVLTHPDDPEV